MARTHYFPQDRVHFTWDVSHEPVIDDRHRRHGGRRDARCERQPDRARFRRERHPEPRLGPRLPARGPDPGQRRRAGRHARDRDPRHPHARAGAGRRSCPASGCCRTTSPTRTCGSSTSAAATSLTCATTSSIPLAPFFGTMGVCPAGASGSAGDAAGELRREHGHAPAGARDDAVPAGPGRRRDVLLRRRARLPGRRRGLRDRLEAPMYAALRFTLEKGRSIPAPQYRTAGGADAVRRLAASTARPASAATST